MAQLILLASLSLLPVASKVAPEPHQPVKTDASATETATIKELLTRITRLEARVRQLEAQQAQMRQNDQSDALPYGKRMQGENYEPKGPSRRPGYGPYDVPYGSPYSAPASVPSNEKADAKTPPENWSPFQFNGEKFYNILLDHQK